MMSELTHGARSFFFWECRLFWATQQVLLVVAALLVGDVVGNPLAVAVIPAIICGVIAARELRMGLLLPADGSAVVIRRVFSDVTVDLGSVDRLVLNDGSGADRDVGHGLGPQLGGPGAHERRSPLGERQRGPSGRRQATGTRVQLSVEDSAEATKLN